MNLEDLSVQSVLNSRTLKGWTVDDCKAAAHVKRFLERITGDPKFRDDLERRPWECGSIASSHGIHIDPMELAFYWRDGFTLEVAEKELRSTSAGKLWSEYLKHIHAAVLSWNEELQNDVANTRFHKWILRRREQYKGVFLASDRDPILITAFELSKGCSRNCWFCGLGAGKLERVFPRTTENTKFWRGVLRECSEILGAATRSGICYWATEPLDNPDYLAFLEDFQDIVGTIPRTATALPLRDLETTRKLLMRTLPNYPAPSVPCSFSILSTQELRRVHKAFSPEELLLVHLRQQQKSSLESKVSSGKLRDLRRYNEKIDQKQSDRLHRASICCLTGFLVNMVDKTLKLVSPCSPSDHWPLGYRLHFEASFSTVKEFGAAIMRAIEECMPNGLRLNQIVSFRRDLAYERFSNGFRLTSPAISHTFEGGALFGPMGDTINEGNCTSARILDLARDADEYAVAAQILKGLFDQGLLEEDVEQQ
jgi:radical SAM family RiPP maturation amino acid epimerase